MSYELQNNMQLNTDSGTGGSADNTQNNNLNLFLQYSSQLIEDIIVEESELRSKDSKASRIDNSNSYPSTVFAEGSKWELMGGDVSQGGNELIRMRTVSAISYSLIQPHLLITAHPYDVNDEQDLRPMKV
jgi:hypothetical protein